MGENAQSVLAALGMGLAAFTVLGFFAFSQPADRSVQKEAAYQQSGIFGYSADVPSTVLYDGDTVTTGDPVFRRLANQVDVVFDYHFASQSPSTVGGTERLVAVLTDNNGWKRTLPLTTQVPFEGDSFTVRGRLSLDTIQGLIDALETETGIKRDHHELYVVPEVQASGIVAGQPFTEAFEPRLGFRFDPFNLQMLPPGPREPDPRTPSQAGVVQVPRLEANTLPVLGGKLTIGDARRFALFGITLCVAAGLAFGFYVFRPATGDEPSRIQERLGDTLVSIRNGVARSGRMVDVESIDDLVKLAERTGGMVLHEVNGTAHQYFVQDGQTSYRYQAFARRSEAVGTASEIAGN